MAYYGFVGSKGSRRTKPKYIMKNEITLLAVLLGLIVSAAYLLSRANPAFTADSLIGFGVVAALLALAALEYRISWKSLIGR